MQSFPKENYLFDGELVKDEGEKADSYLIFDALVVLNTNIMH